MKNIFDTHTISAAFQWLYWREKMTFTTFIICMFCFLAAADLSRAVSANPLVHLPLNGLVRGAFFVLTLPALIAVFALPIYGFVVLRWWQPLLGLLLASIGCGLFVRPTIMGGGWMYLWAIVFSIGGVVVFLLSP
jgi:hypothetical protein